MSNKVLLVDGMALLFRHFYATSIHHQYMRNRGVPTNGVQGFYRTYLFCYRGHPTNTHCCLLGYGTTNFQK